MYAYVFCILNVIIYGRLYIMFFKDKYIQGVTIGAFYPRHSVLYGTLNSIFTISKTWNSIKVMKLFKPIVGNGNLHLTDNRSGRNEIYFAKDNHSYTCHIIGQEFKIWTLTKQKLTRYQIFKKLPQILQIRKNRYFNVFWLTASTLINFMGMWGIYL